MMLGEELSLTVIPLVPRSYYKNVKHCLGLIYFYDERIVSLEILTLYAREVWDL